MNNLKILGKTKISYENIIEIIQNNDINNKLNNSLHIIKNNLKDLYNQTYSNMLNEELTTDACCRNCNNNLLISDNIEYSYQCTECDENFYDFEVDVDEVWYKKDSKEEYSIEFWETDWHRDAGEGLYYYESYLNYEDAIKKARQLFEDNNYSSIEVLNNKNETLYFRDNESEEFNLNNNKFCKVSKEIVDEYIDNWMDNKKLPIKENKIYCEMISSGYLAIDNSTNECFVEEFDTEKQVHDWLLGKDLEMGDLGNEI